MDNGRFQEWLSEIDELTAAQRTEAEAALSGQSQASASLAAVEAGIGEDRRCPRCSTPGAVSRGRANGLRRHQCKGCKRTFNAATGTSLAGLHPGIGCPASGPVSAPGTHSASRPRIAGSTSPPRSAGGTASWPRKTGNLRGSRASSRPTKPTFPKVSREKGSWPARRAAGAARPESAVCRGNRFRFWWLPTAPGRRSARFFRRSTPTRCGK